MSINRKMSYIAAIAALSFAVLLAACGGSDDAVVAVPAAPTGVSATAGDTQAVINWTAVDGADSYVVYYWDAAGISAAISKAAATPAKADSATAPYTCAGLTNGIPYYFAVAAVNAAGEGALSDEVTATPQLGLPGTPTGLAVTVGNRSLTLAWDAVSGATSYKIYWNTAAGIDTNTPNTQTSSTNDFAHANLSNLNTYYYRVAAVNSVCEGPLSDEKSAKPIFAGNELQSIADSAAKGGENAGWAVAVSSDTAIVGVPSYFNADLKKRGAAFVFRYASGIWTQEAVLLPPAALTDTKGTFGKAVAISGDFAIVGDPTAADANPANVFGAAVVFKRTGTTWDTGTLLVEPVRVAGNKFGQSVAIGADYVVVGTPGYDQGTNDRGTFYYWSTTNLVVPETKFAVGALAGDQLGYSVALNGVTVLVGAPYNDSKAADAGAVYLYTLNPLAPVATINATNFAANDWYGSSVSVDGNVAIVGAPSDGSKAGSAIILRYDGATWNEEKVLTPSSTSVNDQFGASVSISGNYALVGAYLNDDKAADAGAAFVYNFNGTDWTEEAKLLASDGAGSDQFGFSVGIDGDLIAIGANLADLVGAADAGAVYFY